MDREDLARPSLKLTEEEEQADKVRIKAYGDVDQVLGRRKNGKSYGGLHCDALSCVVLYFVGLYCTVLCSTELYCIVLHRTLLYNEIVSHHLNPLKILSTFILNDNRQDDGIRVLLDRTGRAFS